MIVASLTMLLTVPTADADPPAGVRDWSIVTQVLQTCPTTWADLLAASPARREVSGLDASSGEWTYGWAWDQGSPPVFLRLYDATDQVIGDAEVDASLTVSVSGDVTAITPYFLATSCTTPRYPRWFVQVDTSSGSSFLAYAAPPR